MSLGSNPSPTATHCVTLGKVLNLSVPELPLCKRKTIAVHASSKDELGQCMQNTESVPGITVGAQEHLVAISIVVLEMGKE